MRILVTDFGRRSLLFGAAQAGLVTAFGPALVAGCGPSLEHALRAWKGPPDDLTDPRLHALGHAVLAANPHNTQAWLFHLRRSGQIDCYVDRRRLLPHTDPPARQIHIGQGTMLETLVLAAGSRGRKAEVEYFPREPYGNDVVEDKPWATVTLHEDPSLKPDPLFRQIAHRYTHKGRYEGGPIPAPHLERLRKSAKADGVAARILLAPTSLAKLTDICERAMAIEWQSHERNTETANWFRLTQAEIESTLDGLSMAQTGMSGFEQWAANTFVLSRDELADPEGAFAEGAVEMTREQAESASAFLMLTSRTNTRRDQLVVGRALARVQLTATALGIQSHPMSQVLQEYADMAALQREFRAAFEVAEGHTVQMLLRLGYADAVPHTPRRDVQQLLRPG